MTLLNWTVFYNLVTLLQHHHSLPICVPALNRLRQVQTQIPLVGVLNWPRHYIVLQHSRPRGPGVHTRCVHIRTKIKMQVMGQVRRPSRISGPILLPLKQHLIFMRMRTTSPPLNLALNALLSSSLKLWYSHLRRLLLDQSSRRWPGDWRGISKLSKGEYGGPPSDMGMRMATS